MTLGQIAFEAYSKFSDGKSLAQLLTLPEWKDLHQAIRDGWEAAALAVKNEVKREFEFS
jgi:hypothetical protein